MATSSDLKLTDGSKVGVIGGGPAGTFFAYFLLDMAERVGMDIGVDIYEPRDFSRLGPPGCNMCGGIVSEYMVQTLATDGINLPPSVVRRGIESYVLSLDVGKIKIDNARQEKRIAAVHRGGGPRGSTDVQLRSFDGYLLELTLKKGAKLISQRVDKVTLNNGKPVITPRGGEPGEYDLIAVTMGIKTGALKMIEDLGKGFKAPRATQTYICELQMGEETIQKYLGNSMSLFLPNIPHIEFACLIPKGNYVTLCLLGEDIGEETVQKFLSSSEAHQCMPPGWVMPEEFCHCAPKLNIGGAQNVFDDRIVVFGDCGITRLNKDGIGAAYRSAKAAARTAIFNGVSKENFQQHFWPVCRFIANDNRFGKVLFMVIHQVQKYKFLRRGVLRTVTREQRKGGSQPLSGVFWDTFTGNAPYRDVFFRTLNPLFILRVVSDIAVSLWPAVKSSQKQ